MVRDTLRDLVGNAVDVESGLLLNFYTGSDETTRGLDSLIVSDCGGDGIRIRSEGGGFNIRNSTIESNEGTGILFEVGDYGGGVRLVDNVVRKNGGDGIRFLERGWSARDVVIGNTVIENAGAGIRAEVGVGSAEPRLWVERNLVAGNGGVGLEYIGSPNDTVSFNDAWMNRGGDYRGAIDLESNLRADPQFCDPVARDFHLAAGSPCAPSGPYGQIGAFGVGCDASTVAIDIKPGSPENVISAGSNGGLAVAILGHRLFDSRQVDPQSIRLAGATLASKQPIWWRDVNGDGLVDLVAHVDAAGMRLRPGDDTAALEASTLYGAPLQGSDHVRTVPPKGEARRASGENAPLPLAISRVRSEGGRLLVSFSLPSSEPAVLELFDVGGRRMEAWGFRTRGVGTNEVAAPAPRAGIYWLRLGQGGQVISKRIVVLR